MQIYNSNIVGSNVYFYKHQRNLESLIEYHWCPTVWYIVSATDNYCRGLHALLNISDNIEYEDMDKE